VPANNRLTILIVPETGKRTRTLYLSRFWFAGVMVVIFMLCAAGIVQYRSNQVLQQRVAELDDLRRMNRRQQAELDMMRDRSEVTAEKLAELENLERQIRELTNQEAPSRGGLVRESQSRTYTGRGGPTTVEAAAYGLPTLSALLPPEVSAHLLGQRDTLPLNLKVPSTTTRDSNEARATAAATLATLEEQADTMDRLALALAVGKRTFQEHLDLLAHSPTGYPVSGGLLTDRFGWRWSPFGWGQQTHEGIDLAQAYWTPIVATADGVVTHAGWKSGGYGNAVIVEHGYGFETWYAHMVDTKVEVGDTVKRGQLLGWVGSTGASTGPHVHYEVHVNGVAVDPLLYSQ
jgi:murein DD-endopeptidase MepM/ murein hydrolase activator NlpD